MPLYYDNTSRLSQIVESVASKYSHRIWEDRDDGPDMVAIKRTFFDRIELNLQALAEPDWQAILEKVVPRFKNRYMANGRDRGWQPAFDILNEAESYRWLASKGFAELQFFPEQSTKRAPDIAALYRHEKWLCEVKTLNRSDREIENRIGSAVRSSSDRLEDSFISGKLMNVLSVARQQFEGHESDRRLLIMIANFDDFLHLNVHSYLEQIGKGLAAVQLPKFDVVLLSRPSGNLFDLPMEECLIPTDAFG